MSSFPNDAEILELAPEEDVYHYLMFIIPIEQVKGSRKRSGCPWGILLAYTIVAVSVVLQSVLLSAIWNSIVLGDIDWQDSVYTEVDGCNPGNSLCIADKGTYSCAPPSVQIATRWDELDEDGDGVWTREEVTKQADTLKCKYAVNPVEVFDVFSKMAVARENILWVHPDVRSGAAIPKPYFDFAAGDVIMCTYRTQDMCPNLLMRGIWDAPLKYNTSPRVGATIDSALKYCYDLLKPGGYCEQLLPSTYAVWKKSSEDQCVGPSFNKVTYEHPTNGKSKSLLAVDYKARQDFKRDHKDTLFRIYKTCIVGIYLLAMLFELKAIIVFSTVVLMFPSAERLDPRMYPKGAVEEETDPDDPYVTHKFVIHGITNGHRTSMTIIVLIRCILLVMLTVCGLMFLEKTMSVLDLLLNGLGLLFIVEISTIMCGQIVNQYLRAELEKIEPLRIPMIGNKWLNRNPAFKDFLWCLILIIGIILTSVLYKAYVIDPTSEALTCACLTEGSSCREASKFDAKYWRGYWNEDVPGVFESIADLKSGHEAARLPVSAPAVAKSFISGHKKHNRHKKHYSSMLNTPPAVLGLLNIDKRVTEATLGTATVNATAHATTAISHVAVHRPL